MQLHISDKFFLFEIHPVASQGSALKASGGASATPYNEIITSSVISLFGKTFHSHALLVCCRLGFCFCK
jgi:hypothetical protein